MEYDSIDATHLSILSGYWQTHIREHDYLTERSKRVVFPPLFAPVSTVT